MPKIILLLGILATLPLYANAKESKEKKLELTPPGQVSDSKEDPGSATRLLYEDPRNQNSITADAGKKDSKTKIKATCTDNMGMFYKKGDSGYDGCLRSFKNAQPNLPGDNKRPPSLGISIGN